MKNHVFKSQEFIVGDVKNYIETEFWRCESVSSSHFDNIEAQENEEEAEIPVSYQRSQRINDSINTEEDYWGK